MNPLIFDRMSRDELVAKARSLGVERPELMTRVELGDEIVRRAQPDVGHKARGWLGIARDMVASVVESGLNLPDAAALIRGERAEPELRGPAPVATVTLAEIYATQGHLDRALTMLDEVLAPEPDHAAALALRERLREQRSKRRESPATDTASQSETSAEVSTQDSVPPSVSEPEESAAPSAAAEPVESAETDVAAEPVESSVAQEPIDSLPSAELAAPSEFEPPEALSESEGAPAPSETSEVETEFASTAEWSSVLAEAPVAESPSQPTPDEVRTPTVPSERDTPLAANDDALLAANDDAQLAAGGDGGELTGESEPTEMARAAPRRPVPAAVSESVLVLLRSAEPHPVLCWQLPTQPLTLEAAPLEVECIGFSSSRAGLERRQIVLPVRSPSGRAVLSEFDASTVVRAALGYRSGESFVPLAIASELEISAGSLRVRFRPPLKREKEPSPAEQRLLSDFVATAD